MDISKQLWLAGIDAEERARLERWSNAWAWYFGNNPKPLTVKPGQANDNVTINYARLIVNIGVSYLFGEEPTFQLDADAEEDTHDETWLNECWRVNKKMLLLQKVAMNGAVCGHTFVKIIPDSPLTPGYPRLIAINPEYVTVVTDPDDIDLVWRYIIAYPARGKNGEHLTIKQTMERNDAGRWTITDEVSEGSQKFRIVQQALWPYTWPPIIDCQNLPSPNEYYGLADLEPDVLAVNHAMNFTMSNLQRIIRFHAHPKTWGRGFNANQLKIGIDETIVLPGDNAELHNLEMQSDLTSSLAFYLRLKEALHEISRSPEVATGKLESVGALSGVAMEILYMPLVQATKAKRLTYSWMLIELNRRLLEMSGRGADGLTTIIWPKMMPTNALEERQTALLEKQLGTSDDTLLRELGRDPDAERKKRNADGDDLGEQLLAAFDRGQ
jgi:hypothetical protein